MNIIRPRRIAAHYTYYRRSLIRNAIVSWSSDGTVIDVTVCDSLDSQPGVEFYNGILIPDFVNAHCHLELSYMEGVIPQGKGFASFAQGMGKFRNIGDPVSRENAARNACEGMWRHGIGAIGDVCNGSSTFALKERSRMEYLNFLELFGLDTSSASVLDRVAESALLHGLQSVITPHSTYSLTRTAFCSAVEAGPVTLPLSVHFMESAAERALFEGGGELYDWYCSRGISKNFTDFSSPASMVVECIPAERDVILVHNCRVTEEDIDMVETHFTGRVTWVLCPRSNHYISRIEPPVGLLRRKGVKIAVGTDSLASNTGLDMVAELRALGDVPLAELLEWSTSNGGEALGIKNMCSGFEEGNRIGAVLISGIDWDRMALTAESVAERIF